MSKNLNNKLNVSEDECQNSDNNSINSINEIGLGKVGKKLTPWFRTNKANGYALIIFVMFCFILMVTVTKPIIITAARQYRHTNLEYAKMVSTRIGIATASPIREKINSTIYGKIQNKLINHTKLFLSESDTYNCQGELVPTKKAGGKLKNVFSICDLTGIFDDLKGENNQSIDFLGYLYPDYKAPFEDPNLEIQRKSIISQFENSFDYKLNTIFVGQEALVNNSKKRIDRFRWQTQATVLTRTYFDVTDKHILYYDIILDVTPSDAPFEGSGSNCDQNLVQPPSGNNDQPPIGQDFIVNGPGGITYILGDGGIDFAPLYVVDAEGNKHPYGTPGYEEVCGKDPYCSKAIKGEGTNCGTERGGDVECTFADGTQYVGYVKPPSIKLRMIRGCASPRTGQRGAKGVDPAGYSFVLTTRLVSVGSTYN